MTEKIKDLKDLNKNMVRPTAPATAPVEHKYAQVTEDMEVEICIFVEEHQSDYDNLNELTKAIATKFNLELTQVQTHLHSWLEEVGAVDHATENESDSTTSVIRKMLQYCITNFKTITKVCDTVFEMHSERAHFLLYSSVADGDATICELYNKYIELFGRCRIPTSMSQLRPTELARLQVCNEYLTLRENGVSATAAVTQLKTTHYSVHSSICKYFKIAPELHRRYKALEKVPVSDTSPIQEELCRKFIEYISSGMAYRKAHAKLKQEYQDRCLSLSTLAYHAVNRGQLHVQKRKPRQEARPITTLSPGAKMELLARVKELLSMNWSLKTATTKACVEQTIVPINVGSCRRLAAKMQVSLTDAVTTTPDVVSPVVKLPNVFNTSSPTIVNSPAPSSEDVPIIPPAKIVPVESPREFLITLKEYLAQANSDQLTIVEMMVAKRKKEIADYISKFV